MNTTNTVILGTFIVLVFLLGLGVGAGFYAKRYTITRRDLDLAVKELTLLKVDLNETNVVLQCLKHHSYDISFLRGLAVQTVPIDCKVVQVSDQLGLVLLNIGSDDGVKRGYEFTIYRADKFVAKAVVETVFSDLAGCRITLEKSKAKEGDLATTRIR